MRTIYILLTRTQTVVSSMIHAVTGDAYTHVALGFDPDWRSFYSFSRRYSRFPFPGGFVCEKMDSGYLGRHGQTPCALYSLEIEDEIYDAMLYEIRGMCRNSKEYGYSIVGLLLCRLQIPHERNRHFFCSQFVANILEKHGALQLPKPPSLMRPADFAHLPQLRLMYQGQVAQVNAVREPVLTVS